MAGFLKKEDRREDAHTHTGAAATNQSAGRQNWRQGHFHLFSLTQPIWHATLTWLFFIISATKIHHPSALNLKTGDELQVILSKLQNISLSQAHLLLLASLFLSLPRSLRLSLSLCIFLSLSLSFPSFYSLLLSHFIIIFYSPFSYNNDEISLIHV